MSSANTAIRTAKTAMRPYSGKSRRSSRNPSPSAIQAVPRIVVLIVTVAGLAGLGDPVEQEREDEREHEAADHPFGAAELRAEQRRERTHVAGQHERPQRARHPVELVQRDERRERRQSEQPPAAEVDDAEHERARRRP